MEQAKQAVSSFLSSDGKHRTDVDEVVNPAVTSETVKPHRHEETTEAIDREVHQDHYHTTVQPIAHQETLPEKHVHNVVPQVERSFQHGDVEQDRSRAAADLGQFRDTSTTVNTTQSAAAAPTVVGEHVHHHVHETVQPVIHKETIQPEVVHTTIPIHEKHIAPSEHHGLSNLPMKTLDEFKQGGVSLTEGHKAHHVYEGHPRPYNPEMQVERKPVDVNPAAHDGTHDPEKTGHFDDLKSGSSTTGTAGTNPLHQSTDERHGSGLLAGAAAGTAVGAGAAAVSSHHGTDRSLGSNAPAVSSHHGTERSLGSDTVPTSSTTTSSTLPGRQTAHGYHTTADSEPSYGKTASGALTGAGDRHGPQDGSSTTRDLTSGTSSATHGGNSGTYQGPKDEPSNLSGGAKFDDSDKVQHASQLGEDPSLTKSREAETGKWRGDGVPGSHSAVFGLTKDGKTYDDTSNFLPGAPKSNTDDTSKRDSGVGADTSSRTNDTGSGKIAEQMHNPRVAEPAHGGSAEYKPDSSTKPGAGADTSNII